MHTARWDHSQDLTGKRVAIIGTGASAVQVIPEIAPIVKHLTVFQRTPIWCFPKVGRAAVPRGARRAMRIPGGKAVQRLLSQAYVELTFPLAAQYFTVNPMAKRAPKFGEAYLRKQVDDPVVRDKLTPRYAVGCKRPGIPQHVSVDVQPRQRQAGHRADRQDHRLRRGHRRRRVPTRSTC